MPSTFVKDPSAVLDYQNDFRLWLNTSPQDTITTSTWEVLDGGLSIQTDTIRNGRFTVVWLTGGTVGESYRVVNNIVTAAGRTDERTITVNVVDR